MQSNHSFQSHKRKHRPTWCLPLLHLLLLLLLLSVVDGRYVRPGYRGVVGCSISSTCWQPTTAAATLCLFLLLLLAWHQPADNDCVSQVLFHRQCVGRSLTLLLTAIRGQKATLESITPVDPKPMNPKS